MYVCICVFVRAFDKIFTKIMGICEKWGNSVPPPPPHILTYEINKTKDVHLVKFSKEKEYLIRENQGRIQNF